MTWQLTYIPPQEFRLPPYRWDKDRELCRGCTHLRVIRTMWQCKQVLRGVSMDSCSAMRSTDGQCGPTGILFSAKEIS